MGLFGFRRKNANDFLIVGLGNFGDQYRDTRHNAGFIAVQTLADAHDFTFKRHKCRAAVATGQIGSARIILAKPLTYMNKSGEAVAALMRFYKIPMERLLVIYDDIDIAEGALRIRPGGSAGTHNGMRSVIAHLGAQEFARVRVGVGAPPKGGDLIQFVMGQITPPAREAAQRAALAAEDWAEHGVEHAMSLYNAKAGRG